MTKIICDCGAEFVVTPAEDKGPKSRYYDGYSKGHDELEARIAETIGEEADSVECTIQDVVKDVVRQRDLMREALTAIRYGGELGGFASGIAIEVLKEAENG